MDTELQAFAVSGHPVNLSFPHDWQVEILLERPAILPVRHYVYPRIAEEVERGALEIMVRPLTESNLPAISREPRGPRLGPEMPFLATCALGFRDPVVPTGVWSTPNPRELCAVSGGYAYIIDSATPENFTMLEFRPALEVRALVEDRLLLFVGHCSLIAWGPEGEAWKTGKLSDEGITITSFENGILHGTGWEMMTDRERAFAVDLRSGRTSTE